MINKKNVTPHDVYVRFSALFLCTISLILALFSAALVSKYPWIGSFVVFLFALFFWGYSILFFDMFLYFFGIPLELFFKMSLTSIYNFYEKYEIWFKIVALFIGYFCFMAIARYVFIGNQEYLESVFQIGQLGFLAFISFAAKEIYNDFKKRKNQLSIYNDKK